jgi:hypothetical protein
MTLIELMVGTALLLGGGSALVMGMHYAMAHSDYLNDFQIAMNASQGRLEELAALPLDTLWNDPMYTAARTAAGQCMGLGEDDNCNGALDVGEDMDGDAALDEPLPGARLNVRIRNTFGAANPTIVDIHVAACWRSGGRRLGEDTDCDGVLDTLPSAEDVNASGFMDSPAMASTRVAVE